VKQERRELETICVPPETQAFEVVGKKKFRQI
jgi:hypothetical protein